ncbi:MAG: hypothetical protein E6H69_01265 [Betaproteobacteria bacterium]|nr:MAG: hypothetical protein E6H69_01265 [Betaproteobacteria bacterium]
MTGAGDGGDGSTPTGVGGTGSTGWGTGGEGAAPGAAVCAIRIARNGSAPKGTIVEAQASSIASRTSARFKQGLPTRMVTLRLQR